MSAALVVDFCLSGTAFTLSCLMLWALYYERYYKFKNKSEVTMSSLLNHAKEELRIAGLIDSKDEMQQALNNHILKIVEVFAEFGHSGSSASYAKNQLTRLLGFSPLTPLTGKDDEWEEVSADLWQNKRCGSVFRTSKGAYDVDGYYFEDQYGNCFTNKYCSKQITFPYTPTSSQKIEIFVKDETKQEN